MKAILYFVLAVLLGGQIASHAENGFAYKSGDAAHKVFSHDRDIVHHHHDVASIDDVGNSVEISIDHVHDSIEDLDAADPIKLLVLKSQAEAFFTAQSKNSLCNFSYQLLRPPRTLL